MSLLNGNTITVTREYRIGDKWVWKVKIGKSNIRTVQERFSDALDEGISDENRRRLKLYHERSIGDD